MPEIERKHTQWYRIENKGNEWVVVVWRHKQPPERVPGTDVYINPADALNVLGQVLMKELVSWE